MKASEHIYIFHRDHVGLLLGTLPVLPADREVINVLQVARYGGGMAGTGWQPQGRGIVCML